MRGSTVVEDKEQPGSEDTFYSPILAEGVRGLESVSPEDFVPLPGTILVVMAPEVTVAGESGGIYLPERAYQTRGYARVAAVPDDDMDCPVKPGDWVVFKPGSPNGINLGGRKDLALLHYCDDLGSDILGYFLTSPLEGGS